MFKLKKKKKFASLYVLSVEMIFEMLYRGLVWMKVCRRLKDAKKSSTFNELVEERKPVEKSYQDIYADIYRNS